MVVVILTSFIIFNFPGAVWFVAKMHGLAGELTAVWPFIYSFSFLWRRIRDDDYEVQWTIFLQSRGRLVETITNSLAITGKVSSLRWKWQCLHVVGILTSLGIWALLCFFCPNLFSRSISYQIFSPTPSSSERLLPGHKIRDVRESVFDVIFDADSDAQLRSLLLFLLSLPSNAAQPLSRADQMRVSTQVTFLFSAIWVSPFRILSIRI